MQTEAKQTQVFKVHIFQRGMFLPKQIGELTDQPDIYKELQIDGRTFSVSCIDLQNRLVGVSEIKPFYGSTEATEFTVCPYCGYEDVDCFELSDDEGEHYCGRCGKDYEYVRQVEITYKITYTTTKKA